MATKVIGTGAPTTVIRKLQGKKQDGSLQTIEPSGTLDAYANKMTWNETLDENEFNATTKSLKAISLTGAIKDSADNPQTITGNISFAWAGVLVDTIKPLVATGQFDALTGSPYGINDPLIVKLNFTEPVKSTGDLKVKLQGKKRQGLGVLLQ